MKKLLMITRFFRRVENQCGVYLQIGDVVRYKGTSKTLDERIYKSLNHALENRIPNKAFIRIYYE